MAVRDSSGFGNIAAERSTPLIDHILIIRALILRDLRIKHFGRPFGFFVEFLRPTLVCVLHYFVFWAMGRPMPANIALEQFVWGGFTIWFVFSQIAAVLHSPRSASRPPFPGVSAMHMRLAVCAWPIILYTCFTFASIALMKVFGDDIRFPDIPLTIFLVLVTAAIGFGWGLLVEGLGRMVPIIQPLTHFLPWLVFLTSGIYFSVVTVPPLTAAIDLYNPVLHLVEYERHALDPGYPVTMVSLSYPSLFAAAVLIAGLSLSRYLRRKPHA